jgi:hypothetical protein
MLFIVSSGRESIFSRNGNTTLNVYKAKHRSYTKRRQKSGEKFLLCGVVDMKTAASTLKMSEQRIPF